MRPSALLLAACLSTAMSSACLAQDLKATQRFTDTQIVFEPGGAYSNYTLTITGPNGVHASASTKAGAPAIDLRQMRTAGDGTYNYQLTASTDEKIPVRSGLDNGRGGGSTESKLRAVSLSGQFQIKGGTIVKVDPTLREETRRKQ
jgi:hypothetical protein